MTNEQRDTVQALAQELSEARDDVVAHHDYQYPRHPANERRRKALDEQLARIDNALVAAEALLAHPQEAQEPVATVHDPYDTPGLEWHCRNPPETGAMLYAAPAQPAQPPADGWVCVPKEPSKAMLAAAPQPPAREPLSDEQIDQLIMKHTGGFIGGMHFVHLARAIEAAHGIGSKA